MQKEESTKDEVKLSKVKLEDEIALEDKVIVVTTLTLQRLFQYRNGSDAVALYMFYCKTAKQQKTEQIWAKSSFCMKGLRWGENRFNNAQRVLKETGHTEPVVKRDKNGKIIGWYMRINYVWKEEKAQKVESILKTKEIPPKKGLKKAEVATTPSNQDVVKSRTGLQRTNAILNSKQNAIPNSKINKAKPCFAKSPFFIFLTERNEKGMLNLQRLQKQTFSSVKEFNALIDELYADPMALLNETWSHLQKNMTDRSALIRMLQNRDIGLNGVLARLIELIQVKLDREEHLTEHKFFRHPTTFLELEKKYSAVKGDNAKLGNDSKLYRNLAPERRRRIENNNRLKSCLDKYHAYLSLEQAPEILLPEEKQKREMEYQIRMKEHYDKIDEERTKHLRKRQAEIKAANLIETD